MFTPFETWSVSGSIFVLFVAEETLAVNMGCISSCFGGTQPGTGTCCEPKRVCTSVEGFALSILMGLPILIFAFLNLWKQSITS